jgi:hypothetical protein
MPTVKITEGELEDLVQDEHYLTVGTLTICVLELRGGFKSSGTSAPINDEDFDAERGCEVARAKAFGALWELEAYHRLRVNAAPWQG